MQQDNRATWLAAIRDRQQAERALIRAEQATDDAEAALLVAQTAEENARRAFRATTETERRS